MEHTSVSSLVVVLIIAFLTPILLHRLKLGIPVVVAEIIMGLFIGKSGLNLVTAHDTWLETLSMLGFIFLMFLSGLEIDFSAFEKGKKKQTLQNGKTAPHTFKTALIVFTGIFILSLALSYGFVWAGFIDNAFLMTLIISTISLGVVVPTLKEERLMKTNIGQIILLVAVIADLATMILLAVFASIYSDESNNMWLLIILFAAGVVLYLFGRVFKHRSFVEVLSKGTIQIGTRAIFTLIIVLVALSESLGAENILGAFLAGVLVSLLSPNKELVQQLDSFGYGFLIPIFFVMTGVKLDIWSLFENPKILVMIPLLFVALLLSKTVPALVLCKWYDFKKVLASGFLLTSTLSLVIAATTIGERIGIIDAKMSGALILVAVITCIITPVVFKKWMPKTEHEIEQKTVTFIGANQMTLPVTLELSPQDYNVRVLHMYQENKEEMMNDSVFDVEILPDYEYDTLQSFAVFDTDILVVATGNEERNIGIALFGQNQKVKRIIARADTPKAEAELKENGIEVFSIMLSTKTLLRALIEAPGVMKLLTHQDTSLYEININNERFDSVLLREFPFTGDVIFVRIFRGIDSIVPHGDTMLQLGDRLIATGSREYIAELKKMLED
ncbi:monovalent cation:proton antiporter family protein [Bacillus sp. CLL-7-23]|uniref:Monovalent cation:proton antiporter family protein n=1 Tax=Bacillus changyiensis TaxID=3004103 RepID=A0ABT4X1F8_9BACI|nr:monovalent cation:proton antiporter family protein [Bacillus changyiensis]MDA7026118.1 monovalent cation:proton antiporter family protein [Bacillus changyiensis]